MTQNIRGVLAASVTPLAAGGERLDEAAFEPLADFLAAAGLDGILAMGTTGEGILLGEGERRRVIELFVAASDGRLRVIAHAGAQTTRETAALAAHAAERGADGVAVIGPPYFPLDTRAIVEHFSEAARACAPLPFYIYEFAARSGYAVPREAIVEIRERCPNLTGLKVSDTPWESFETYLLEGFDVFVGPETLIARGMERGAVGAVSALAAALPELVIEAVRTAAPGASARCGDARDAIQRFPFHSALKSLLGLRGVPVSPDVRRPLRPVDAARAQEFEAVARELLASVGAAV